MVVDPANAYRWVSVSGTAELRTEGGDAGIDHLSNKFIGKDYPYRQPGEVRVTVRVPSETSRSDRARRLAKASERPDTTRRGGRHEER